MLGASANSHYGMVRSVVHFNFLLLFVSSFPTLVHTLLVLHRIMFTSNNIIFNAVPWCQSKCGLIFRTLPEYPLSETAG